MVLYQLVVCGREEIKISLFLKPLFIFLSLVIFSATVCSSAYAATTVGTDITTTGSVGIGTVTPTSGYKLDLNPGTGSGINISGLSLDGQNGINTNISIDNPSSNTTVSGIYNNVTLSATNPGFNAFGYGIYNEVTVNTPYMGIAAFPAGIINQLNAAATGSQITGIKTHNLVGGQYPTGSLTTTDAFYTALYAGGTSSQIRGERLELFLKNDDGVAQSGYGTKMAVHNLGTGDTVWGWYMDDTASAVVGGTEYGVYLNLDDSDATRYGIYEVGGANNYFKGNIGWGDTSPDYSLELYDVTNTPAFALSDDDVVHGLTTLAETDVFSHITSLSTTAGGTQWTTISDTDAQALLIRGVMGSIDPTDTTSAIKIIGVKSNGTTGVADLGELETVFQVANNDDIAGLTILGSGNVGVGVISLKNYLNNIKLMVQAKELKNIKCYHAL